MLERREWLVRSLGPCPENIELWQASHRPAGLGARLHGQGKLSTQVRAEEMGDKLNSIVVL